MTDITTANKIAMYVGGGLVVLGVVGIGILEMLLGSPHPVSGEGQIVHEALVPLAVRSYMIIAGFLIWGLTAIYNVFSPSPASDQMRETSQDVAG